jgi:hypothetical protein
MSSSTCLRRRFSISCILSSGQWQFKYSFYLIPCHDSWLLWALGCGVGSFAARECWFSFAVHLQRCCGTTVSLGAGFIWLSLTHPALHILNRMEDTVDLITVDDNDGAFTVMWPSLPDDIFISGDNSAGCCFLHVVFCPPESLAPLIQHEQNLRQSTLILLRFASSLIKKR